MKKLSEWSYLLPSILRLIEKSNEEIILQTTMPMVPVRGASGLITEYRCEENPICMAMVDTDTLLICSAKGKARLCSFDWSSESMNSLTKTCDLIHASNYCQDLILLPQNRFLLASAKYLSIASYGPDSLSHLTTIPHRYDFIANMVGRGQQVLMACLSSQCILWNSQYMSPIYQVNTGQDPIAIDFVEDCSKMFVAGGYGSGSMYFYDVRTHGKVLEVHDQSGNRLTCLKSVKNYIFSGIAGYTDKICLYDFRKISKGALAVQRTKGQATGIIKTDKGQIAVATREALISFFQLI